MSQNQRINTPIKIGKVYLIITKMGAVLIVNPLLKKNKGLLTVM
jgi:hypothetical protein